jgi:hypothetical protein
MIDAQSIAVACAACYDDEEERSALNPIFRGPVASVAGAAIIANRLAGGLQVRDDSQPAR